MRREFKNDYGMFIHHVFGIALTGTVIVAPPSVKKYVPIFGTVEVSTIFLSIMWLMRETGNTKGRGFKVVLAMFAASFFWYKDNDDALTTQKGVAREGLCSTGVGPLHVGWALRPQCLLVRQHNQNGQEG